jgi:hypothetical protein
MARTGGVALIGGMFFDPSRARGAFETLMGEGPGALSDVDVLYSSFNGNHLIFVTAKNAGAERRARRVFREFGAVNPGEIDAHRQANLKHDPRAGGRGEDTSNAGERALLDRWAALTTSFIVSGIAVPLDLVMRMFAAQGAARSESEDGRSAKLREVDTELRDVSARLASVLRERHPELFSRAGRLRTAELTRRLIEASGGKHTLSGDDLIALETAADDEVAESTGRAT